MLIFRRNSDFEVWCAVLSVIDNKCCKVIRLVVAIGDDIVMDFVDKCKSNDAIHEHAVLAPPGTGGGIIEDIVVLIFACSFFELTNSVLLFLRQLIQLGDKRNRFYVYPNFPLRAAGLSN